jgi:hypothetical protein
MSNDPGQIRKIFFLCPDLPHISGGVRVLYRQADVLIAHGYAAAIVHQRHGFRPSWFASDTRVLYPPLEIKSDDILVFTEIEGPAIAEQAKGIRKVIYNQSPYFMFRGYSIDPSDLRTPYEHPDVLATVVVSEDSKDYMTHVFPELPVYRVRNSIDPRFCPSQGAKKKQICFMPRKHYEDAQQVLNLLKFRGVLGGWVIAPIHDMREEQVMAIMRESAVFLSFGYPEGFGLPPAEAMASRCVVVGYHGNGASEYFTPDHGFPIEIGDIVGFARAAEHVIRTLNENLFAFDNLTARAMGFIRSTYTPENEQRDILECWQSILNRCGSVR